MFRATWERERERSQPDLQCHKCSFLISEGTTNCIRILSAGWLQLSIQPVFSSSRLLSTDFWQQKHPFLAMLWRNQEVYQAAQDQQHPASQLTAMQYLCNISLDADFKDRTLVKSTAPTSLQSLLLESPSHGHKPVPARWIYHDGPFMTIGTATKLRI